jgi:hypothetical protein
MKLEELPTKTSVSDLVDDSSA